MLIVFTNFAATNKYAMKWNDICLKLKEDAERVGLPEAYYDQITESTTQQEIINILKCCIEFCISHRWPSSSFIKQHFKKNILIDNGLLIDDDGTYPMQDKNRRFNYMNRYFLSGKSNATIRYSFRPHSCTVWVCDNSTVTIDAKYGAFFEIHLYDNAFADVTTDLVSKATVIKHSRHARLTKAGVVTTIDDFYYLE